MTTKNKVEAAKNEVEELAAQMKANRERVWQLGEQSREAIDEIYELQESIAEELAAGGDATDKARRCRERQDDSANFSKAIELLDRLFGEIEQKHNNAILSAARIAQEAAAHDYGRVLDEMFSCLVKFYQSDVSPLLAELASHAIHVREAENTIQNYGGLVVVSHTESHQRYAPQSSGRALPLARALEDCANGEEYSASWQPVRW